MKAQQIFKEGCGVELRQKDINTVVGLGKYSENRSRPVFMSIRTIDKKSCSKISQTEKFARRISVICSLTKNLREELQELINVAVKGEENDHCRRFMYGLECPPWNYFIKKIPKQDRSMSES